MLSDFLAPYDCEVYKAFTGKQAIDLLSQKEIEIAILDIRLPDTDGISLLDTIRLQDPTISVVMITGYNDPDLIIEAMKKGASDFIMKPFSIDKLLLGITRVRKQRELLVEKNSAAPDLEDRRKIEVLNRQLQAKITELTKMHHISSTFNSMSIFDDVYEKTVRMVNEVLGSNACGYYIMDQENFELILYRAEMAAGADRVEKKIAVPPELMEQVKSGKRHFLKDNKAFLALIIKGEWVGAIMMGKQVGRPFEEERLQPGRHQFPQDDRGQGIDSDREQAPLRKPFRERPPHADVPDRCDQQARHVHRRPLRARRRDVPCPGGQPRGERLRQGRGAGRRADTRRREGRASRTPYSSRPGLSPMRSTTS